MAFDSDTTAQKMLCGGVEGEFAALRAGCVAMPMKKLPSEDQLKADLRKLAGEIRQWRDATSPPTARQERARATADDPPRKLALKKKS